VKPNWLHEPDAPWYSAVEPMQILFAISILCFVVLLGATVAITRRIRASNRREDSSMQTRPEFSQYLFAAGEGVDLGARDSAGSSKLRNSDPGNTRDQSGGAHFKEKTPSPKRG